MSNEQKKYLKKLKTEKLTIYFIQLFILIIFFVIWELLAKYNIINSFIFSSPSKIVKTIINLIATNNLFIHIFTTLYEVIISFIIGLLLGFICAIILYSYPILAKILDPFLTMFNSLPKVALGPLIIIICGANTKSIIVMALLINFILCLLNIYNGFNSTDEIKIKLVKSFNASKIQVLKKVIIPSSFSILISSLKINISMSLIGVIMGEFLISKKGIGYLIIYGTQVFNLNLVMSGIILLVIISYLLYIIISKIEKKLLKKALKI